MEIENIIGNTYNAETCDNEKKYIEGGITKSVREVNKIQRNAEARKQCLDYYFKTNEHYKCQVCGFDFEEKYGEIGKYFIEVHHIKPHTIVSREIGQHEIDPRKDLLPVCSNCHSIIHVKKEPLEIDEIKNLFARSSNGT
jgi:5-methylcytosine-specific restriction protein A